MRRTEALQGVRVAMFLNRLNGRWESGELKPGGGGRVARGEGADVPALGRAAGSRRARPALAIAGSARRRAGGFPADRGEEVERLDRARSPGFTAKPFPEPLIKGPASAGARRGRSRLFSGRASVRRRRARAWRKRERRPLG